MQNVPKIVTERLRATPPEQHPDADLLTAFAEHSLSEPERLEVLEHMARCRDCREIVAMALPATEVAPALSRARGSWFTGPALRWGFAAAGILAVASIGGLQYHRHLQQEAVALQRRAETQTVAVVLQPTPPAGTKVATPATKADALGAAARPPAVLADKEMRREISDQRNRIGEHQVLPFHGVMTARGGPIGGPMTQGAGAPAQWQQQQSSSPLQTLRASSSPPLERQESAGNVPAAPQAGPAQSPNASLDATTQYQPAVGSLSASQQVAEAKDDSSRVGKAKPAEMAQVASSTPATASSTAPQDLPVQNGNSGHLSILVQAAPTPQPRWTISSSGMLQRSLDQGVTWQDVDVNANSIPAANLVSNEEVTAAAAKKRDSAAKLVQQQSAPVFRAVTAAGGQVWAGGSNGMLYHSVDGGNSWIRVNPSSNGSALTSDIVSLEFSDLQHGRILTSTGEVWTTTDIGQTWQKQ